MEWIKFKDKWPKDDQEFLVYSHQLESIFIGDRVKNDFRIYDNGGCLVPWAPEDSWMPLPDKPKE